MEYYLEILSFHIMAVLSWMAVLFYMPRLFVYHQEHQDKKDFTDVIKIQEIKIYKVIGLPAMWATIISGVVLIYLNPSLLEQGWMIAKLFVLALLIAYSFSMEYFRKLLEKGSCYRNGQFFRAYNEVPTLFSILIVVFVVTKSVSLYFSIFITLFFGMIIYKILTKRVWVVTIKEALEKIIKERAFELKNLVESINFIDGKDREFEEHLLNLIEK